MKNSEKPINPIQQTEEWYQNNNPKELIGLTKREYFAGLAMQGMLTYHLRPDIDEWEQLSEEAVKCADKLLKQLESNEN